MFQFNKIKQMGPMNKQRGLEPKRNYLQKLVNSVEDIYNLAVEHDLTGELFYGGHLPKVVSLLENHTQSKWYKQVVKEKLTKPQKWPKLQELLVTELEILQVRVSEMLEVEDKRSSVDDKLPSSVPKGNTNNDSRSKVNNTFHAGQSTCIACDEKHYNRNGEFVQCRTFLLLSAKDKADWVRKKKRCLQCLNGKAKFDSEHECSDVWLCPNKFHDGYDKKLHFLLCDKHTDETENKKLFELFKTEVLKAEWQKKIHSSIFITCLVGDKPKENIADNLNTDVVTAADVGEASPGDRHVTFQKLDVAAVDSDEVSCGNKPITVQNTDQSGDVDKTGSAEYLNEHLSVQNDEEKSAAYILQSCQFYGHTYSCMFDTACKNFVCRDHAVDTLPVQHKKNTKPGPIIIGGVGCSTATSTYGKYLLEFPTHNGDFASFNSVSLPVITGAMPPYPVKKVRKDIVDDYIKQGGNECDIPGVPTVVGGETDFLIGILYNWYQPRLVHILPTGLAIYKSMFVGTDGTRGCIGGAHELFLQCEQQFFKANSNVVEFRHFLQMQLSIFQTGFKVCLDVSEFSSCHLVSENCTRIQKSSAVEPNSHHVNGVAVIDKDNENTIKNKSELNCVERRIVVLNNDDNYTGSTQAICLICKVKFLDAESAGSVIEYRCPQCRGCGKCKKGDTIEKISFKEEYEQSIIEECVTLDPERQRTIASLPFICDPNEKLAGNRDIALKVYRKQVAKLARDSEKRLGVIHSERKLQNAGHVDWVRNISGVERSFLDEGNGYYLPWRFVENEGSISTPIRVVFDASSSTSSGYSLNDILAKGINSMNSLVQIIIRFCSYAVAVHTDIKQMYNVIKLRP